MEWRGGEVERWRGIEVDYRRGYKDEVNIKNTCKGGGRT